VYLQKAVLFPSLKNNIHPALTEKYSTLFSTHEKHKKYRLFKKNLSACRE
jgi:hypothetical protein